MQTSILINSQFKLYNLKKKKTNCIIFLFFCCMLSCKNIQHHMQSYYNLLQSYRQLMIYYFCKWHPPSLTSHVSVAGRMTSNKGKACMHLPTCMCLCISTIFQFRGGFWYNHSFQPIITQQRVEEGLNDETVFHLLCLSWLTRLSWNFCDTRGSS